MSSNTSRVRSKVVPHLQQAGNRDLGYFQNWSASSKKWGNPIEKVYWNPISWSKYTFGQRTWDEVHDGPPYLSGGPFNTIRISPCDPPMGVYGTGVHMHQNGVKRYVGGFTVPDNGDWMSTMSDSTIVGYLSGAPGNYPSMDGWGDKAYQSGKPKLEKAGGGVFLAEARDLPRMMKTSAKGFHELWKLSGGNTSSVRMHPKKAADQFLNDQFGWSPFLKDLGKFYHAFDRSAEHISRLTSENGQWVRKRGTLKSDTTRTLVAAGGGIPLFPNTTFTSGSPTWFPAGNGPMWAIYDEVSTIITYSAKFRYFRPEFDRPSPDYMSVMNRMKRQMSLYGLRVNPSNIYKATPWTWAADWVSNLGDLVDRANDQLVDSIANKYLFVMQHQVLIRRFTQTIPFVSGTVSLEFTRFIETKQRAEGLSPYGFSLSLANLTPRQLAIAGALGISRT